jgi:hypothetical protein
LTVSILIYLAGANVPSPGCRAVISAVPVELAFRILPLKVATVVFELVKVTGRPLEAVADRLTGGSP